jgi:hypothetical protein
MCQIVVVSVLWSFGKFFFNEEGTDTSVLLFGVLGLASSIAQHEGLLRMR